MPEKAAKGITDWIADERRQKQEKQDRIDAKKKKQTERMEKMEVEKLQSTLAKINGAGGPGQGQGRTRNTEEMKAVDVPVPPTVGKPMNGSAFVVPPTVAKQVNGTSGTAAIGDSDGITVNGGPGEKLQVNAAPRDAKTTQDA